VAIDVPTDLPVLPAAVEVAAYRIALEALTNVSRHACATRCVVELSLNGSLELEIRDDGRGLQRAVTGGIGIISMRERAEELGGSLLVEAAASGRGTIVHASLPVESA
jgi:signal transduction histidine kinase